MATELPTAQPAHVCPGAVVARHLHPQGLCTHIATAPQLSVQQPANQRPFEEINGFIIFHFCLLAPSFSKPLTVFSELEDKATALFKSYNTCRPFTQIIITLTNSSTNMMMEKIPNCLKFDQKVLAPYCNASYIFHSVLDSVSSKNKTLYSLCNDFGFKNSIVANVAQLKILLNNVLCYLPQRPNDIEQNEPTSNIEKQIYFWRVFQHYEQCMKQMNVVKAEANVAV
ncbi:unnamed protein product [Caretta caretta]